MESFVIMLNNIDGSYYGFVVAVLSYVKKNQLRFDKVKAFIEENKNATTSDVLLFISQQNDFFEDSIFTLEK